jgi:cell shape-determining protein MreD
MIYYLFLPVLLFFLVIIQITILDIFALRWIDMEISMIIVIYAGFHFDAFRGGLLSLVLGFFMDCLTSAIFGLYIFLYIVIFYFSMIVAGRVYAEKSVFIAFFAGFCTLLEGIAIVLLYRFFFSADIFYEIPNIFIPQAVVLGLLSPLCFRLFHRFEVFLNARDTRPTRQVRAVSVQE